MTVQQPCYSKEELAQRSKYILRTIGRLICRQMKY